jgi:pyridoxamine 5'-phosphate oxidase
LDNISGHIADIRVEYKLAALDEQTAGEDPLLFFQRWFQEAEASHIAEVNAMTLATVDDHHRPHARIVLLKGLDAQGFLFYTNYHSAKGRQIAANAGAALVFFWKELERQVRIEGIMEKTSDAESDAYFLSRPYGSRIGAWASPQSSVIENREVLDDNYQHYAQQYADGNVARPPHWGGYRLLPDYIEFWQGRTSRMHDRIAFIKTAAGWDRHRLAP